MKTLTCDCGEIYHVGDAPRGGSILCRKCGRVLSTDRAVQATEAPPKGTRQKRRREPKVVGLPGQESAIVRRTLCLADAGVRLAIVVATALSLGAWLFLLVQSDRSALGMLAAFAPRWWFAVAWLPLLIASVFVGWRYAAAAVVGAAVTLFGVAGFELPMSAAGSGRRAARIVTYNTDRSTSLPSRIRGDLDQWQADVAVFQDCPRALADTLGQLSAVATHRSGGYCMVSRWPLASVDSLRVPAGGGPIRAMRYAFTSPAGPLTVYSVHLSSPRTALWDARNLSFGALEESAVQRRIESRAVSLWVNRADSATVVAGDFNLPDGSRALREGWGDMTDAFEARGFGLGHTMRAGRFTVRIDHVLSAGALAPADIRVETGFPSEHRPVLVEFQWRSAELVSATTRPPPPTR